MYKKKQGAKGQSSKSEMDTKDQRFDIKSILSIWSKYDQERERLAHHERRRRRARVYRILEDVQPHEESIESNALEMSNQRVMKLPPKNKRTPLSVARVAMKKQKQREERMQQENLILGRFSGVLGNSSNKRGGSEKRRPENRVLKSTVGNFRNGVLDVKHMLNSNSTPRDGGDVTNHAVFNKGKKKKGGGGGGRKNQGKKKGGGKRH